MTATLLNRQNPIARVAWRGGRAGGRRRGRRRRHRRRGVGDGGQPGTGGEQRRVERAGPDVGVAVEVAAAVVAEPFDRGEVRARWTRSTGGPRSAGDHVDAVDRLVQSRLA